MDIPVLQDFHGAPRLADGVPAADLPGPGQERDAGPGAPYRGRGDRHRPRAWSSRANRTTR
ncbi:hypothetical protein QJS66_04955 [Kocuria rhizophila]|nr:hypothetical protein QJS66_04955 [Kocuria rhizophila]